MAAGLAVLVSLTAWAADGDLDTGFSGDGKIQVAYPGTPGEQFSSAAVQANGDILAAGIYSVETDTGATSRLFIARFSAAGALLSQNQVSDPVGADFETESVVVGAAGQVIVVGNREFVAGDEFVGATALFAAYNGSGQQTLAPFAASSGDSLANTTFCEGDMLIEGSKLLAACTAVQGGVIVPAVVRLNIGAGAFSADSGFGSSGIARGSAYGNTSFNLTADSNANGGFADGEALSGDGSGGYYLLAKSQTADDNGDYPLVSYQSRLYLQHFTAAGAVDSSFGSSGIAEIDRRIVDVSGNVTTTPPSSTTRSGATFQKGYERGGRVLRDGSGRILVATSAYCYSDSLQESCTDQGSIIARRLSSGMADTSFFDANGKRVGSSGGSSFGFRVEDLMFDNLGRLYVLGDSQLGRLSANGVDDPAFGNGSPSNVNTLNRPASCNTSPGAQVCFSSTWKTAVLSADSRNALLLGGVQDFVAEDGGATAENAIIARARLDDTPDTVPDDFAFVPPSVSGVALNTLQTSSTITVAGISAAANISVSAGSSYSIDGGAFVTAAGTVNNGQAVRVRHTSSASGNATVTSTLSIGGKSATFSSTTRAADTTPDAFAFAAQTNRALNSVVVSNAVTIGGIDSAAPIAIAGGTAAGYSIGCNGTFTAAAGTIGNGATVCVRQTASASPNTQTTTTLTIGGVSAAFAITTGAGDSTPDAFAFVDKTGVATGTVVVSDPVTVAGIDTAAPVGIAGGAGQYSINGGAFTTVAGTVSNGQTVRVRVTSSVDASSGVSTTLTIGGVSDVFTATTGASDTTPAPFSFVDQTEVATGSSITSAPITVSGITAATPVSVSGGSYSIDGGAFVTAAGTVGNGQTVRVRHTSASSSQTTVGTTLTIGGLSDTFSSTTAPDRTPDGYAFTAKNNVPRSTAQVSNTVLITGIDEGVAISVSGGQYSISCDPSGFTAAAGTISNTQSVCVRHNSSAAFGTAVNTVLTVGGVAATFTSTTEAEDSTPDAFVLTDRSNVGKGAVVESAPVGVAGINSAASISVSAGGSYSINGGAFTGSAGTVSGGDAVRVRHTSSANDNSATHTVLTIGGVSDTFTSTTGDGTPNAFGFAAQNGVNPGSTVVSAATTIGGLTLPAPVSVSGGAYSIDGGAFTTAAGTVSNGQSLRLQHSAAAGFSAATTTTLTIGGVSGSFTSTTVAADTVPDAYSFAGQSNVARDSTITSASVAIAGINTAAPISVSGGSYSIDGGAFTTAAGTVSSGQSVRLRHTSAAAFEAATTTTLTVGGVSAGFTSTTEGQDVTPAAFSFPAQSGAAMGSQVVSDPVTVGGINAPVAISVTGGEYGINGGAFTAAAGTVNPGDVVRVRVTSASAEGTEATATLTIGGVSATFAVRTAGGGGSGGGSMDWTIALLLLPAWLRLRRQRRAAR